MIAGSSIDSVLGLPGCGPMDQHWGHVPLLPVLEPSMSLHLYYMALCNVGTSLSSQLNE